MELTSAILIALGLVTLLGLGAFAATSLREGERRASRLAFGLAVALALIFALSALLPAAARLAVLSLLALVAVAGALLFALPTGRVERGREVPQKRHDERDIMFARARLEPGSPNYDAYYTLRPENKAGDDRTRSLPGLLSPDAREANPPVFAACEATFDLIETLRGPVDGPVAPESLDWKAGAITDYVKSLTRFWGAHSVGIAELRPYHIYSHIGRGRGEVGAPITLDHRYAIAFSVEMDRAMVGTAPAAPTLLESARQYANAAQIAIQLGNLIRSQGYPARAHIDGNYRVIAPLVARDAGLGEIGRMGLLMTPALGPRVRLGVVTTDLPLLPDPPGYDTSVLDFCRLCQKCAEGCPVGAIPFGDRQEIDGALRWRIKDNVCFRYWTVIGTDCARCMALCPYAYPDSPVHNVVRWAIRRSGAARRAVIRLDRVFYGPDPAPKTAPSWIPPQPPGDQQGGTDRSDINQGATHGTQ
ncbi:MAG: reductive dehalogenase domain-containing protein [Anaerolineae bacterium]